MMLLKFNLIKRNSIIETGILPRVIYISRLICKEWTERELEWSRNEEREMEARED
jgi:hypothetical protein